MSDISVMKGTTLSAIHGAQPGSDEIVFTANDGRVFRMFHRQDCCESVQVEDVCGDVTDLIGSPIVVAEVVSSDGEAAPEHAESYTWTFYKIATHRGAVTLRWLGTSNGYYSEYVEFEEHVHEG